MKKIKLNYSAAYKLKPDTFILEVKGGTYLRNSQVSVVLEGKNIYQWIERIIPFLNGVNSLESICTNLSLEHKSMIKKILEILLRYNCLKEIDKNNSYNLSKNVVEKYKAQIEYIDYFKNSAFSRFQKFRKSKTLIIGSGMLLNSIVYTLLANGKEKVDIILTKKNNINIKRLIQIENELKREDPDIKLRVIGIIETFPRFVSKEIKKYKYIIYAEDKPDLVLLSNLEKYLYEFSIMMFTVVFLKHIGVVSPVLIKNRSAGFLSLWYSVQQNFIKKMNLELNKPSIISASTLSNICVFELFKIITACVESELINKAYLLNLETLEGAFHKVAPHPLNFSYYESNLKFMKPLSADLIGFCINILSDKVTGIILNFSSENLNQLPLSHYQVQVSDLAASGPGNFLPKLNIFHLTHTMTRKEGLLKGIEAYIARPAYIKRKDIIKCNTFPDITIWNVFFEKTLKDQIYCVNLDDLEEANLSKDDFNRLILNKDTELSFGAGFATEEAMLRAVQNLIIRKIHNLTIAKKLTYTSISSSIVNSSFKKDKLNFDAYKVVPSFYIGEYIGNIICIIIIKNKAWYGIGQSKFESITNAIINSLSYMQSKDLGTQPFTLSKNSFLFNGLVTEQIYQQDISNFDRIQNIITYIKAEQKKAVFLKLDNNFIFSKLGIYTSALIISK